MACTSVADQTSLLMTKPYKQYFFQILGLINDSETNYQPINIKINYMQHTLERKKTWKVF